MSGMAIRKGLFLFVKALVFGKPWSLSHAAEQMYRLNITARNIGRHPITDQIYELKNALIKYLYQHGYCTEVKLHSQKRVCRACDGTGVHYNGNDCWKCDGTGVFAVTQLYAFRFEVAEKRYAWHQLRKFVDYPIVLTNSQPGLFVEPAAKEDYSMDLGEAWLACCEVWWFLLFRGVPATLVLFRRTRLDIWWTLWSWRTNVSSVWRTWRRRVLPDKYADDSNDIPF